AIVACSQSSDLYFIDLTAKPPALIGKPLSVGTGTGDTFYPAGIGVSPDGQYAVVTSTVGGNQRSTQIRYMLFVSIADQSLADKIDLQPEGSDFTEEAAAISPKGPSVIVVSPSSQPPKIFALPYNTSGSVTIPDSPDNQSGNGLFAGPTGYNVGLSKDG